MNSYFVVTVLEDAEDRPTQKSSTCRTFQGGQCSGVVRSPSSSVLLGRTPHLVPSRLPLSPGIWLNVLMASIWSFARSSLRGRLGRRPLGLVAGDKPARAATYLRGSGTSRRGGGFAPGGQLGCRDPLVRCGQVAPIVGPTDRVRIARYGRFSAAGVMVPPTNTDDGLSRDPNLASCPIEDPMISISALVRYVSGCPTSA